MTGADFRAALKRLGLTQKEVARRLAVNEDTLTARCRDVEVPALYRYALLGLEAEHLKPVLDQLSENIGRIAEQNPTVPDSTIDTSELVR